MKSRSCSGALAVDDDSQPGSRRATLARGVALCAALALAYLLFGVLARVLLPDSGFATPLWPAAGIAFAALACRGTHLWPGVVAGVVLVEAWKHWETAGTLSTSPSALALSVALGLGAAAQAVLGARLVRRHAAFDEGLLGSRDVVAFLMLGGPMSCAVGAACVGVVLAAAHGASGELIPVVARWWLGDTIGVLVTAPLAVALLAPSRTWRGRRATVALPVAACIVGALALNDFAQERESARLRYEFESRMATLGGQFSHVLDRQAATVRSIASMMTSMRDITRGEFRTFVTERLRDLPGTQALGWNRVVDDAGRDALERRARSEGATGYRIWERGPDGEPRPARGREIYVPVYFTEPLGGNEKALGYDIASEPRRAATLQAASDSNELRATAPVRLVQESGTQAGVLMVMPVFHAPHAAGEGERAPHGYAVGVFRMTDALRAAFAGLSPQPVTVTLADVTEPGAPEPMGLLHLDGRHDGDAAAHAAREARGASYRTERVYRVGGRRWRLAFQADERFMAPSASWSPAVALGASALGITLLGAFLLVLSGRTVLDRRRASALAEEVAVRKRAESALGAEKERAEVTLHSIGDAVITTDGSGLVDYLNPVAEAMTGWTLKEARGLPLARVFRIVDESTDEPAADPVARCLREGRIIGLANQTELLSRSGRRFSIQDSAAPIRDAEDRVLGVVLVFNDVTESRRMAREAERAASLDPLTELVNRREFERRLDNALRGSRMHGARHALCFIDLDQFKVVNDTAGHRAGDALLKDLAALLQDRLRERDTLARLGGDEFGLLLDNCPLDMAADVARQLVGAINEHRFAWEARSFHVGASIGVVPIDARSRSGEEVMSNADVACYAAKDAGRNRVYVYDTDSDDAHPRHLELLRAADLRNALEAGRFRLHVQPVVALGKSGVRHPPYWEVLLRLQEDDGSLLAPDAFIPAAERYGLMDPIDRWVVVHALDWLSKLRRGNPDLRFGLNLSGNSLNDEHMQAFLERSLGDSGVAGDAVCFEITETAAIRNLDATVRLMTALKSAGCRFALDDFGSGLSSFGYLKRLPIDYLKIYGGFVRAISSDATDRAMVRAVNQVAHDMNITSIAEWAEDEACVATLRELGVDYAQGHALGREQPIESLAGPGG